MSDFAYVLKSVYAPPMDNGESSTYASLVTKSRFIDSGSPVISDSECDIKTDIPGEDYTTDSSTVDLLISLILSAQESIVIVSSSLSYRPILNALVNVLITNTDVEVTVVIDSSSVSMNNSHIKGLSLDNEDIRFVLESPRGSTERKKTLDYIRKYFKDSVPYKIESSSKFKASIDMVTSMGIYDYNLLRIGEYSPDRTTLDPFFSEYIGSKDGEEDTPTIFYTPDDIYSNGIFQLREYGRDRVHIFGKSTTGDQRLKETFVVIDESLIFFANGPLNRTGMLVEPFFSLSVNNDSMADEYIRYAEGLKSNAVEVANKYHYVEDNGYSVRMYSMITGPNDVKSEVANSIMSYETVDIFTDNISSEAILSAIDTTDAFVNTVTTHDIEVSGNHINIQYTENRLIPFNERYYFGTDSKTDRILFFENTVKINGSLMLFSDTSIDKYVTMFGSYSPIDDNSNSSLFVVEEQGEHDIYDHFKNVFEKYK